MIPQFMTCATNKSIMKVLRPNYGIDKKGVERLARLRPNPGGESGLTHYGKSQNLCLETTDQERSLEYLLQSKQTNS
jgi:hypothetical protein